MADEPCQLVEESYFTDRVSQLAKQFPRIYEVVDGQFVICRDPRLGTLLPGETGVYLWRSNQTASVPSFRFLYAHDSEQGVIHLLAIDPIVGSSTDSE